MGSFLGLCEINQKGKKIDKRGGGEETYLIASNLVEKEAIEL